MHVGRYRVVRELGRGEDAAVFLAEAPGGGAVALKVPLDGDPGRAARLRAEARARATALASDVIELFEHEGRPVLVVRYSDHLDLDWALQGASAPASAARPPDGPGPGGGGGAPRVAPLQGPRAPAGPPPSPFDGAAELALDDRARRSTRALEVPRGPSPYPEPPRRKGAAVKVLVGLVAVVGLGGVALKYGLPHLASRAEAQAKQARALDEERLLRRGGDLPSCFRGDDGYYFVYRGPDGGDVVVERISAVPKASRRRAKCVKADR